MGLRASDLAVDEETGADCVVETGGRGDGLPVSIDERTESRNCLINQRNITRITGSGTPTLILAPKADINAQVSVAEKK